jgi:hypothetical protein
LDDAREGKPAPARPTSGTDRPAHPSGPPPWLPSQVPDAPPPPPPSRGGQNCPICWKNVRGSLEQHQASSTTCLEWQAKRKGTGVGASTAPSRPDRVPCIYIYI